MVIVVFVWFNNVIGHECRGLLGVIMGGVQSSLYFGEIFEII